MKGKFEILMVIAVLCLPGVMSGETGPFFGRVEYTVSLPMADDDIVYNIELSSCENRADLLLGENYLIRWNLPSRAGAEGFTAYFNGHFYDYRENRLREYHYQWDSIPFLTRGGGVQRNAQFFNLFPFAIEKSIEQMRGDSTYTLTETIDGQRRRLHGVRTLNGSEALQFDIEFDLPTGLPLKVNQLFNPGMLGEQEVQAKYTYPRSYQTDADETVESTIPATEEDLIGLFPDEFARFRTSNYTIENLRGLPLPGFALPTPTHERYLYNKGERFATPKILAMVDSEVASSAPTIEIIREVANMLPRQTGMIFAFIDNDVDRIETLIGAPMIGETTLTSARSLARDTGANSFPTILLVNSDGTVNDVILGYSSDLQEQLLQKAALLK